MKTGILIKRVLVIGCALVLAIMGGCAKKASKNAADTKSPAPQVASTATESNTDIFDEFYKEDGAATKPESKTNTAPSDVSSKPTAIPSASGNYEFSENGRYTVQISCVVSPTLANRLVDKLKESGYPAYSAEVQNPTPSLSGTYYRVRIGGFAGLSIAKAFAENALVPAGYEYWIDSKSNDNVGAEGYGLGSSSENQESSYTPASAYTPASTYQSEPTTSSSNNSAPISSESSPPSGSSTAEAAPSTPVEKPVESKSAPTTEQPKPAPAATSDDGWGNSDSSAW